MIMQRFLTWYESAGSADRAEGALVLAQAYVEGRVVADDRLVAEAALVLMLDDASPKVRRALAEALADSRSAPRMMVRTLCQDGDAIAGPLALRSPVLTDEDLIDLVASGSFAIREAIVQRRLLSVRVSAALAELGEIEILCLLLQNAGAAIAGVTFRRIAERHGADAEVRGLLLEHDDLPSAVRQSLIMEMGRSLSTLPILRGLVGDDRANRIVTEACERATATLAENSCAHERAALIEHLRTSGQLTPAFLIRAVCTGNIDLFVSVMIRLSSLPEKKVRSVVADGREAPFRRLVKSAALPEAVEPLLRTAVLLWREIGSGRQKISPESVPQLVMQKLATQFSAASNPIGFDELMQFLSRLAGESVRTAARSRALRLAA